MSPYARPWSSQMVSAVICNRSAPTNEYHQAMRASEAVAKALTSKGPARFRVQQARRKPRGTNRVVKEKNMKAMKDRYGSGPSPSLESSVPNMTNASIPRNSMSPARMRTAPDMAVFGRDCLSWSLTFLTSLFGICVAFVVWLVDPLIAESWGSLAGSLFGCSMAFSVVLFGGFLSRNLIVALRREARGR